MYLAEYKGWTYELEFQNYNIYDMTMKKKRWKKYVTRNHKTSCCIYGKNTNEKDECKKASPGLFLAGS